MITNKGSKMIVTAKDGSTATRQTDILYKVAIVGRNAGGKLVVCFASMHASSARDALATVAGGGLINHKFKGCKELELVTRDDDGWVPEADPDAWKARDAALIAAHRAK